MDWKALYKVGSGRLSHNPEEGFHLTGCDGKLDYRQSSRSMYTCEAIPYWYQIDDVIGLGNNKVLYYAFPTEQKEVVIKSKLAVEETFKLINEKKRAKIAKKSRKSRII